MYPTLITGASSVGLNVDLDTVRVSLQITALTEPEDQVESNISELSSSAIIAAAMGMRVSEYSLDHHAIDSTSTGDIGSSNI